MIAPQRSPQRVVGKGCRMARVFFHLLFCFALFVGCPSLLKASPLPRITLPCFDFPKAIEQVMQSLPAQDAFASGKNWSMALEVFEREISYRKLVLR